MIMKKIPPNILVTWLAISETEFHTTFDESSEMVFKNGEKISQNGTAIISEKYNINTTASYLVKTDNKFKNRINSTEIN